MRCLLCAQVWGRASPNCAVQPGQKIKLNKKHSLPDHLPHYLCYKFTFSHLTAQTAGSGAARRPALPAELAGRAGRLPTSGRQLPAPRPALRAAPAGSRQRWLRGVQPATQTEGGSSWGRRLSRGLVRPSPARRRSLPPRPRARRGGACSERH